MSKRFGQVQGGYVDRIQEWDRPPFTPLAIARGHFVAWITATDLPAVRGGRGFSACAWEIVRKGRASPVAMQVARSRRADSDEQKSYAAAALAVIELMPLLSGVTIFSRNKYVTDAINGDVDIWLNEGRLDGSNEVKYPALWKAFLAARDGSTSSPRRILIRAKLLREDDNVIKRLKKAARLERNGRG